MVGSSGLYYFIFLSKIGKGRPTGKTVHFTKAEGDFVDNLSCIEIYMQSRYFLRCSVNLINCK